MSAASSPAPAPAPARFWTPSRGKRDRPNCEESRVELGETDRIVCSNKTDRRIVQLWADLRAEPVLFRVVLCFRTQTFPSTLVLTRERPRALKTPHTKCDWTQLKGAETESLRSVGFRTSSVLTKLRVLKKSSIGPLQERRRL